MAAIPFPTDGSTPQAQQPPALGLNSGGASTGQSLNAINASTGPPSSISDVTPPLSTAQTPSTAGPGPGPSHSAIGSISMPHPPHSAGGPGPIPIPPPPLRIGYGMGAETHGPPSPSTLTDVILGLHATLYASKKSSEEVTQMVSRYYDNDAVFESPLLQARGREQIANQFKMAFALPGMDVQSELRDVICSDFEFDGTRAGIIDHTLTITLFPTLFGSASYPEATGASATAFGGRSGILSSHFGGGNRASGSASAGIPTGASSYFHGRQSVPASAGISSFTVPGSSYFHQMHPFTPMSAAQTPYGYPGNNASTFAFSKDDDDDARSFAGSRRRSEAVGKTRQTPAASVGGADHDDDDMDPERDGETGRQFSYGVGSYSGHAGSIAGEDDTSGDLSFSTSGMRGGRGADGGALTAQIPSDGPPRPAMPAEALMPHWSASGFGRASVRALVWSLFHPRAALKALCSFQIRVMTRLEFNDNGMIVRHEDMWSVREAIEGIVPFAGLVYALERRIVGFLVSWAAASGITISQLLLSRAIDSHSRQPSDGGAVGTRKDEGRIGGRAAWTSMGGDAAAHEVERALLQHQQRLDRERERASSSATHSRQPTYSSVQGEHPYATFSRSRAPSPTRRFGSISGGASSTNLVTGTRSRARSLIGQNPHLRAASSQNLLQWSNANSAYNNAHGPGNTGGMGGDRSGGWH